MYPFNTLRIPWLAHFDRAQEHFVKAEGICTILRYDLIRIHNIVFRFGHFLHLAATDIFTLFQDKGSIGILCSPVFESFHIQLCTIYHTYIHMQHIGSIFIFQPIGYKLVCARNAIYKPGATLDHTLVEQFSEWLIKSDETQIV
ncbi:hypothetical protein D3C86_1259960 [compost metagenome]